MSAVRLLRLCPHQSRRLACKSLAYAHSTVSEGSSSPATCAEVKLEKDHPVQNGLQNCSVAEGSEAAELPLSTRKFALLMAYRGRDYRGMQVTPGVHTIESVLFSALVSAQCVPDDCATTNRAWMRFQRCARTDKGVSALGQLVSVRLRKSSDDLVQKINAHLPADIRILGAKQVTKGFSAKDKCDGRTYSYTLPTFALSYGTQPDSSFRISREDFHRCANLFSFYQGTHRFHNFTAGMAPGDPRASRYILRTALSEPYVDVGHEFVKIEFTGQSFILHQIRKMVALVLAVVRGLVPEGTLPWSVQRQNRISIPIAPGLGLVLEQTHFDRYNWNFGQDGFHSPLVWDDALLTAETFRGTHILPSIVEGELDGLSVTRWLKTVRVRHQSYSV